MSEQEFDAHRDVLRADQARRLEAEAVTMLKKYGLFLPAPAKSFFRNLADFLNWHDLKKELK